MFTSHSSRLPPGTFLAAALVSLVSCAHEPPGYLVKAREAYLTAQAGQANTLKPAEVHKAFTALQEAERSFTDDPKSPRTVDLAYIALRKVQLAEALAAAAAYQSKEEQARDDYARKQRELAQEARKQLRQSQGALVQARLSAAEQAAQRAKELAEAQASRAAAEQEARAANEALLALQGKEEARGTVITLSGSVLFPSNESTLLPSAQRRLDEVAAALVAAKRGVVIEGHTDSTGPDSYNQHLSQRRADSVRQYIIGRGLSGARVEARGLGETRPVADNGTPEGRANNRRVEIVVEKPIQAAAPATP